MPVGEAIREYADVISKSGICSLVGVVHSLCPRRARLIFNWYVGSPSGGTAVYLLFTTCHGTLQLEYVRQAEGNYLVLISTLSSPLASPIFSTSALDADFGH